jgi:hypothetical protein
VVKVEEAGVESGMWSVQPPPAGWMKQGKENKVSVPAGDPADWHGGRATFRTKLALGPTELCMALEWCDHGRL